MPARPELIPAQGCGMEPGKPQAGDNGMGEEKPMEKENQEHGSGSTGIHEHPSSPRECPIGMEGFPNPNWDSSLGARNRKQRIPKRNSKEIQHKSRLRISQNPSGNPTGQRGGAAPSLRMRQGLNPSLGPALPVPSVGNPIPKEASQDWDGIGTGILGMTLLLCCTLTSCLLCKHMREAPMLPIGINGNPARRHRLIPWDRWGPAFQRDSLPKYPLPAPFTLIPSVPVTTSMLPALIHPIYPMGMTRNPITRLGTTWLHTPNHGIPSLPGIPLGTHHIPFPIPMGWS